MFKKILIANRGEISIRISRAATELGIGTVAVYSHEDRFALHRFKADESYLIGEGKTPVHAYLGAEEIVRLAKRVGADAIHPGYGFLSENPDFATLCAEEGITFIGPSPDILRQLGNKVAAKEIAKAAGAPTIPASGALPTDVAAAAKVAEEVGYPMMLKASWGGGGRGMRVVRDAKDFKDAYTTAASEAEKAFGSGEVFAERLIERARHIEVQILGDTHGTLVHLYDRDCSVQRRHQKIVERAPATGLPDDSRAGLLDAAVAIGRQVGYVNAGTVEFLVDADTGEYFFIEVNPRIQVEHTVTEEVTGVDLVQAQIRIAAGARIGEQDLPAQDNIRVQGHAIQCRITTEDPANSFIPDYGRVTAYRGATGFGIRLDGGTAYSGALVTRAYDSLLEKVTAWGTTPEEATRRMNRALREFRIRGVNTNLAFLENVIDHPDFVTAHTTTRFIDETPELFEIAQRRDRATKLLTYIGDVMVNGRKDVAGRVRPTRFAWPKPPADLPKDIAPGVRDVLENKGPDGLSKWMLEQSRVLITDTTMRDAHQSLLATRMRTHDMVTIADAYARLLPELFSLECWGGATFDVAMRFLDECPWDRLTALREAMPNLPTQMLLRASNAVGYTSYPDNVVSFFVERAADAGMDIFRIFDSLNDPDNMRIAMDTVLKTGKVCEAAICYSGDMLDPGSKYSLEYYLEMAETLKGAGAHILGIKDMAGVCKPEAARKLVKALKREIGLPVHFHTHDTSGISAASVLAAADAGADAVDAAMDAMSGLTAQPSLGGICAALADTDRDPGIAAETVHHVSHYWEAVRNNYAAFESDFRAGTADVYRHAMPGGQYTNLREQARAMHLDHRWNEVADAYARVNALFGDIVKVTPTSKVVGDMALFMVGNDLSDQDVLDPKKKIDFPDSVISLFRGELGRPKDGFPKALQDKVLSGEKPIKGRPGAALPDVHLATARADAETAAGRDVTDEELASYLMYPKVFADFAQRQTSYSDLSVLPTPVFFYGMELSDEISIDLEPGKTLIVRALSIGEAKEDGTREVFFELNGQPRSVVVVDDSLAEKRPQRRKAADGNPKEIPAPMPGLVSHVAVAVGDTVAAGDSLITLEAMKMETALRADADGTVAEVLVVAGDEVDSKDLLIRLE